MGTDDGTRSWDTTNPFSLNSLFFSNESNHFHFRGECKGEKVDRSSSYTQSDCSIDDLDERHGNLVSGMRSFGSQYLRQLRSAASGTVGDHGKMAVDMVMFGEFGRDLDKEKAVCVAVAMQRLGLVGHISLVASGNGAPMRARLALGTARKLEAECTAAIGHEGSPQDEVFPFEFDHCDYLAEEAEVDPAGGHELVFTAIGRAAREGRRVCIVVSSSLTDMAAVLRDARWPEASAAVSCVVVSGGATQPKADGRLVMDPAAGNNASDLRAAKEVYNRLQASERPPFYVVSRHAAGQCQLQRLAFHGSLHPVAQRFQHVSKDIVQSIWARVNRSMAERKRVRDSLPARCNVHWFREHFLSKDAPKDLKATDPVWEWAKNLRETCSDGLATVVATLADKPALMVDFFTPQKSSDCNLFLLGLDSTNHGINNPMALSKLIHELMIVSVGSGNGEWFRLVTDVGKVQEPVDAIIIGDYGKDLDDEKALCVASVLRGLGLIGSLAVVANLGDSTTRARLAKGSLLTLNQTDVPVAAGSHGGRDDEELYEHEFAHCDYLAPVDTLDKRGGHELIFASLGETLKKGRKACIILGSAFTDMAKVLDDPRWKEVKKVVACVSAMGGAKWEGDRFEIDKSAANHVFDLPAAERVYSALQQEIDMHFVVLSRFAAGCCQMPRGALDGSDHPMALRFKRVSEPGLQKLWERSHRSLEEREALKDALPARCDSAWFRSTFLEAAAPAALGPQDAIWRYVKGFNEYDALAVIAGVAASHPPLLKEFFDVQHCPVSGMQVIGLDAEQHGVAKPQRASEFLHDCLIYSFQCRLRTGGHIQIKSGDNAWEKCMLYRPLRSKGPDMWIVCDQSKSPPIFLERSLSRRLEGHTWKLLSTCNEPLWEHPSTSLSYRMVNGMTNDPLVSDAGWQTLRAEFEPKHGDVWLPGPHGIGRASVHAAIIALKGSGRLDDVDMAKPHFVETAIARGRFTFHELSHEVWKPHERVFKTFNTRLSLPVKPWPGWLPAGIKVVIVARDPRDVCCSTYNFMEWQTGKRNIPFSTWVDVFCKAELHHMTTAVSTYTDWWKAAQACPDQILWLIFEDMMLEPEKTVRQLAAFLDVGVTDETVLHLSTVFEFAELKRRFGPSFGPLLRNGRVGSHKDYFSADDYEKLQRDVIDPLLSAGVPLTRNIQASEVVLAV